jgi:hypothetical protein
VKIKYISDKLIQAMLEIKKNRKLKHIISAYASDINPKRKEIISILVSKAW